VNRTLLSVLVAVVVTLIHPYRSNCQSAQSGPQLETQSPAPSPVYVVGEISVSDSSLSSWTVELLPFNGGYRLRTALQPDGLFSLPAVAPGEYELRVMDVNGRVVHDDTISLRRPTERLSIAVQSGAAGPTMKAAAISLQQLQHKVPGKARAEFKKGEDALRKQQALQAVEHLKAAVTIDPAFADAQNDLGIAYLRLKEYTASAEQFQKVIALDRAYQPANDNLCIVLLKLKRYQEASQIAGNVLRHGDGSAIAHYTAAVGLVAAGGKRSEALDHLRRAQDDLPAARLLSAQLLAQAGRRTDAVQELQTYLRSPEAEAQRRELEAWLAELTR
jgi:Tfp pilus assembly protein PilF